jgi:hypothetical protein
MGHTFALDDFYDWLPPAAKGDSNFVMKSGSAFEVTEFDAWMLRDWWRHLAPVLLPTVKKGSTGSATPTTTDSSDGEDASSSDEAPQSAPSTVNTVPVTSTTAGGASPAGGTTAPAAAAPFDFNKLIQYLLSMYRQNQGGK